MVSVMLNAHDLQWMKDTVASVIEDWQTNMMIYSRLPLAQQTNYNKYMKEYSGDIICIKNIIQAERKDIVNNQTNNPEPDVVDYGKRNEGVILYAIKDYIIVNNEKVPYKPSLNDIVKIDNSTDVYYIRNMRDRIGETLIIINRFVGSEPNIVETDNNIVIRGYSSWGDV